MWCWRQTHPLILLQNPQVSQVRRGYSFLHFKCSSSTVKNLPAVQETKVHSLGPEDPLNEGMATHSNILAWKIPWTEKPGGLQPMKSQRVGCDLVTKTTTKLSGC